MSDAGEFGLPVNSYQLIVQQFTELWDTVVERSIEGGLLQYPYKRDTIACLCGLFPDIDAGMDKCWVCDNCRENRYLSRHKKLYHSANSPINIGQQADPLRRSPAYSPASSGLLGPNSFTGGGCCNGKDPSSLCLQCQNLLTSGYSPADEPHLPDAFTPGQSPVPNIILTSSLGVSTLILYSISTYNIVLCTCTGYIYSIYTHLYCGQQSSTFDIAYTFIISSCLSYWHRGVWMTSIWYFDNPTNFLKTIMIAWTFGRGQQHTPTTTRFILFPWVFFPYIFGNFGVY